MSQNARKWLLAVLLAGVAAAFFALDLGRFVSFEYLKSSRESLQAAARATPVLTAGLFSLVYLSVVAANLPGAGVLGLAAGAIFGLWPGVALVSALSTLGASLACLVSRYLLRDWVRRRFGKAAAAMDKGIAREGGFYLFGLRLVPAVPFFLINLGMGLTSMPISRFALVSFAGMLPGTILYVNAGRELAGLNSPADLLSGRLALSFVLLALAPLTAKRLMDRLRRRRSRPSP